MRALVAGGAGFIGSHLVDRLLDEGHEVDVVDDLSTGSLSNLSEARAARTGRLKIHQVDVRDEGVSDLVEQRRPEVVYVLVGPDQGADVIDEAARTVIGGLRLLDGARRAGARKVVVATGAQVYGTTATGPVREADADEVRDVAAASPLALLTFLRAHREAHDIEFAMLVLSTVYGPRQRRGLVAGLVDQCWSGGECAIDVEPSRVCDLVFVDDVVDAFVRAADRGSGLVVNVAAGSETTAAELHAEVARAVVAAGGARPGPLAPSASRRSGHALPSLDPGRARIQLGWAPWTDVGDGVRQTVEAARPAESD